MVKWSETWLYQREGGMECSIPEAAECDLSIPIPRGGPIYVPNMVGPSTRVPDFQTSLLSEIQVSSLSLFSSLLFIFFFLIYPFSCRILRPSCLKISLTLISRMDCFSLPLSSFWVTINLWWLSLQGGWP